MGHVWLSRGAGRARRGPLWRGRRWAWALTPRVVLLCAPSFSPAAKRGGRCAKLTTRAMARGGTVRMRSRGLTATFLLRFLRRMPACATHGDTLAP